MGWSEYHTEWHSEYFRILSFSGHTESATFLRLGLHKIGRDVSAGPVVQGQNPRFGEDIRTSIAQLGKLDFANVVVAFVMHVNVAIAVRAERGGVEQPRIGKEPVLVAGLGAVAWSRSPMRVLTDLFLISTSRMQWLLVSEMIRNRFKSGFRS